MKKIIDLKYKYIVGIILAAGLFFQAMPALAASFNDDPLDYPTLQVGNSTTQQDTLNWSTSVSANAGEIIAFLVYYHNTSNETATQTRVRLTLPSSVFTSANASVSIWATNANTVNGQVSINLNSSQILTFIPGTVRWYPNGGSYYSPQTLPYSQTGDEIISSTGLNIGDIAAGWSTQGYLTLKAQVSNSGGGGVLTQAPTVSTYSAYNIGQTYGTLSGSANPNNSNTTTWFEYGTTQSLGSQTSVQSIGNGGSSISTSAYLSNLQQNTTYYFRAVAQNAYGTSYGNILSFVTNYYQQQPINNQAPTVYTNSATNVIQNGATLNGNVNSNSSNTTVWFEYGNSYSLGSTSGYQTVGSANYSSNISAYLFGLSPNTIYYFRAVAQNAYGTSYGNILSFTTNNNIQTGGLPSVNTLYASSISQSSAVLNGSVNSNNDSANAWFEWGETLSMGNITFSQGVNQNVSSFPISSNLSGLRSGTLYYFRAVARNSYGTAYGNTYNFRTQGGSTVTYIQPAVQIIEPAVASCNSAIYSANTTVDPCGNISSVVLTPSVNNISPMGGEEITLTVLYKNETSKDIKNALLKIFLPQDVTYVGSNREVVFSGNNLLQFNLGTVPAYNQGSVGIKVNIGSSVKDGTNLAFNSVLDYTNSQDKQGQVNAYLALATGAIAEQESSQFMASLIGLFGYLFNSWVFNILLIILVLFAAYYFYHLFIKSQNGGKEGDDFVMD